MNRSTLEELISAWLDGRITDEESELLQKELRNSSDARALFQQYAQLDATMRVAADEEERDPLRVNKQVESSRSPRSAANTTDDSKIFSLRAMLTVAAAVIVCLSAGLYWQHMHAAREIAKIQKAVGSATVDAPIAKITGLNGDLIWTGDRGQLVRDIKMGTELAGGTIEGMAPDSWFELTFNDGTTVTISGTSMLTFADQGQKELRLREGVFSANVKPQPEGKPLLLHTRSALLEVLGTQFDVEAGLTSTALNVSEGKVRLKRLSDGREVDVPANHRAVAGDDHDMQPELVPDSVPHWKSRLDLGPQKGWGNYGKWIAASDEQAASVRAIPFVPRENQSVTLHLLGIALAQADDSPVRVESGSRFVLRGKMDTAAELYFGIRVSHDNGDFGGMFLARQAAPELSDGHFQATFDLANFALDPCVWDRKDELPSQPDDLVLNGVWSFTATGKPTGLEVTEVELMPAAQ